MVTQTASFSANKSCTASVNVPAAWLPKSIWALDVCVWPVAPDANIGMQPLSPALNPLSHRSSRVICDTRKWCSCSDKGCYNFLFCLFFHFIRKIWNIKILKKDREFKSKILNLNVDRFSLVGYLYTCLGWDTRLL